MRYSDCYPGCGGEDCPCCEIFVDHQAEDRSYPRARSLFEEENHPDYEAIDEEEEYDDE